jgi:cell division protein FtsN
MGKTDGEYELVLGNRQLLSAFFIIVILFGVFFTMGYVVGRNSAPASAASLPPTTVASSQRPEAASPAAAAPQSTAPAQSTAPVQSAVPPPVREETKEPVSAETKPAPAEKPQKKQPAHEITVRPASPPAKKAEPATAGGLVAVTPGSGNMFLQVAAVAQPQAGVVVDTLKQKGFPVKLAPGPNATLFRVMVGPFADAATLGKAKADLESAGFHPLVRK